MKINNDDVKKITGIKQYFLDPPVSYKLYDYALANLNDAIAVLNKYAVAKETVVYLNNLHQQLQSEIITTKNLRAELKNAGIKISKLTNQ